MLDFTWRARTESLRSLRQQQWYTSPTDRCILCTSGQLETMSLLFHTVDSIRTSKDVNDKRSFWHWVRSYWTPPTVRTGGGHALLSHSPGTWSTAEAKICSMCTVCTKHTILNRKYYFDKYLLSPALNISDLILYGVFHRFILKRERW